MKRKGTLLLALAFVLWFIPMLHATTVTYEMHDLGGGYWRGIYEVRNDSPITPIQEFTIYFEYNLYQELSIPMAKQDWDVLVVDPVLQFGLPERGFYDALATGPGIVEGASEAGFHVGFKWVGQGTPGPQQFDIVDPTTYATLDSGTTVSAHAVPEAEALFLFSASLILVSGLRRLQT